MPRKETTLPHSGWKSRKKSHFCIIVSEASYMYVLIFRQKSTYQLKVFWCENSNISNEHMSLLLWDIFLGIFKQSEFENQEQN